MEVSIKTLSLELKQLSSTAFSENFTKTPRHIC
jgi:hypothetical protein